MPRAKDIKAAPYEAASRMSKPVTTRKTEPQLELVSAASSRDTTGSDDSEGLVKTQRNRMNKNGAMSRDMLMSGAVAEKDTRGARVKPLTGRKRAVLSRIVRNADHDKAIEALKARRDAALAAEKGIEIQVPSSIPTEPTLATKPMVQQDERTSERATLAVAKNTSVPATPQAGFAPAFRGSNFKRRPRQPSLLQLVQAQANPPDEDDDDDFDDFHPDDESSPFFPAKSQPLPQISPSSSPESSANQSSSRKRKRSTPVVQVERSQSPETRVSSLRNSSETPQSHLQEEDVEDVCSLPLPTIHHGNHSRPSLPGPKSPQASSSKQWSDTCAPPQSSSPTVHEPSKPLNQGGRAKRSPPLASPVSNPLKPLSTATLQNLLPRRRIRPTTREHDSFDITSSSDAEIDTSRLSADADELSVAAKPKVRTKKQTKHPFVKTPSSKKKKPHGTASSKEDGRGAWTSKPPKKTPQLKKLKKPKTYARTDPMICNEYNENNNASGKNDDDNELQDNQPSSNPPTEPSQASSELQRLARKFREVDRWELEVEDVTPSSGSQRDAR